MKVERGRPLRPQTRYPRRSFRSNFQYFCELHRAGNIGSNFARALNSRSMIKIKKGIEYVEYEKG